MIKKESNKKTSFGYETVTEEQKTEKVKEVFDSVATNYDLMNDMMSIGVHRLWKRYMLTKTGLKLGMKALDVAGGTGDIAALLREQVGESGLVVMTDINESMLEEGRSRLLDRGKLKNIEVMQADAENLPFEENHFDCVTIAFGLRNVTVKENALKSMHRVLKPGGKMVILEFSKPNEMLSPIYDLYSFNILPRLGEWVANDRESYQYLAESIRVHPDQKKLKQMILSAGFDRSEFQNLTGGIVALHIGYKD